MPQEERTPKCSDFIVMYFCLLRLIENHLRIIYLVLVSKFTSLFLYFEVKTRCSTRVKTRNLYFSERCCAYSFSIESTVLQLGHYMLFHVIYHDLILMIKF